MASVAGNPIRRALWSVGREVGGWPPLMRVGLGIFALGGSADVAYHAGVPAEWGAFWAHLITLVGMVTIMVGVLTGRGWKRRAQGISKSGLNLKIPKEV